MNITIKRSVAKSLFGNLLDIDSIEKSRKGEVRPHKYIFRKATGNPERPYIYVWLEDLLKNPMGKLKEVFGITEKRVDESFEKNDIKNKFGADKKTFMQHYLEYFCHKDIWDKRFKDKALRTRYKKPIPMENAKNVNDESVKTPEPKDNQLDLFAAEKKEPEFRANPSLMRAIWAENGGRAIVQQDNAENKEVKEAVKTIKENKPAENKDTSSNVIDKYDNIEFKYDGQIGKYVVQTYKDNKPDELHEFKSKKAATEFFNALRDTAIEKKNLNATKDLPIDKPKEHLTIDQAGESAALHGAYDNAFITTEDRVKNTKLTDPSMLQNTENSTNDIAIKYNLTDKELERLNKRLFDYADKYNLLHDPEKLVETLKNSDNWMEQQIIIPLQKLDYNANLADIVRDILNYKNAPAADNNDLVMPKYFESEAEKHDNRSAAMIGNQNAKKYGLTESEYTKFMNRFTSTIADFDIKDGELYLNRDVKDIYGTTPAGTKLEFDNVVTSEMSRLIADGNARDKNDRIYLKDLAKKAGYDKVTDFMAAFMKDFIADHFNYSSKPVNTDTEFHVTNLMGLPGDTDSLKEFADKLGFKVNVNFTTHEVTLGKGDTFAIINNGDTLTVKDNTLYIIKNGSGDYVEREIGEIENTKETETVTESFDKNKTLLPKWEKTNTRDNMKRFLLDTPQEYYNVMSYAAKYDLSNEIINLIKIKGENEIKGIFDKELNDKIKTLSEKNLDINTIDLPKYGLTFGQFKTLETVYENSKDVNDFRDKIYKHGNASVIADIGMENLGLKKTFDNTEKYLNKMYTEVKAYKDYKDKAEIPVEDNSDVISYEPVEDKTDNYNSEYAITKQLYKDLSKQDLEDKLDQAKKDLIFYSEQVERLNNETENPNILSFASAETIAENKKANKYNLEIYTRYVEQTKGKIAALQDMIKDIPETVKVNLEQAKKDLIHINEQIDLYKDKIENPDSYRFENPLNKKEEIENRKKELKKYQDYAEQTKDEIKTLQDKLKDTPEGEAEKHLNRSLAMLGNKNAAKYGMTLEEVNKMFDLFENSRDGREAFNRLGIEDRYKFLIKKIDNYLFSIGKKATLFNDYIKNEIESLYNEYRKVKENGENQTNTISGYAADSVREVQSGRNEDIGHTVLSNTESTDNVSEPIDSTIESGIGPAEPVNNGDRGAGTGRLSKGAAKDIRQKCIDLLNSKTDEEMTEADKALLAQYEGAGGLHEKDKENTSIATLTEFYTPRDVISKVWQLVDKYNPNQNKKVLEPSCGTGRFAEGRNENFTLVEWDETSARIAKILHPDCEVKQGAFQDVMGFVKNNSVIKNYKGEKYDVVVGNPPYGNYAKTNGYYKGVGEGKIHEETSEYFVDRSLDTLKDGGILAFVMPSGFLRNLSNKGKEAIAKKGKLLEAWRLPQGTFSSTDTGTDIVVIRKEPGNIEDFCNNKYFEDNPSHVIGNERNDGQYGSAVVHKLNDKTIEESIDMIDVNAVERDKELPKIAEKVEVEVKTTDPDYRFVIPGNAAVGEKIYVGGKEGKITAVKNGAVFYSVPNGPMGKATNNQIKFAIAPQESEEEKHTNRSNAMKGNDNAKKDFHKTPSKKNKKDPDYFKASIGKNMTADEFNQKYNKKIPAEDIIYWKNTKFDGTIDIWNLSDKEREAIKNNPRFTINENGDYVAITNYASGNIYDKLALLEANKDKFSEDVYNKNKAALNAAMPEFRDVEHFTVSPLDNFGRYYELSDGTKLIDKFLKWGRENIPSSEYPDNIRWSDIVDYIAQKPYKISKNEFADDKVREEAKQDRIKDRREFAEAEFNRFIRELPVEEKETLAKSWNERFNAFVNPDYSEVPVFVEGMNTHMGDMEFTLTDQQLKGVSELCNKGNGILAYDVGVGKTVTGIVATINQLQTGKAKRPLICVPKSVYKNWIKEIKQHFPDVKINELSNFSDKELAKFKDKDGKINLPEGCLNICTYNALEKITFTDETLTGPLMDDMLDSQSIHDYDENGNTVPDTRSDNEKAKQLEKIKNLLGSAAKAKEGALFWESFGFDHITIDEMHNFKNVFSIPRTMGKSIRQTHEKQYNIFGKPINDDDEDKKLANEYSGISGSTSARGMKMFAITQLIQAQNNGSGVFGLSATPFNNSPVEIYSILSLVARNRLKDLNIYNLQDFMQMFAEIKPDWKVKANGDTEMESVMKNFKNLNALQALITEYIDKVDGEEAGVVRPYKQTLIPALDLTPMQKAMLEVERLRMEGHFSKGSGEKKSTADTLVAMNNMRMITLSPSLIDPKFMADYMSEIPGFVPPSASEFVTSSPKLSFVCNMAAKQYNERPTEGQVIYMPRGVGGKKKAGEDDGTDSKVEGFEAMKDYLVKTKGLPPDSIAFLRSGVSLDEKEQIMNEFNDPNGKIKIIIGSETIKEGVNLNGNSTTLYNTMLGWNPTETIQVEGRIWRQGNKQGHVSIVYPLMNDSIDAMMYQKYDEKSSRLNALWSYKGDSLNVEDIDPEEMKRALIKDPKKRADFEIKKRQADLKKQKRILNSQYDRLGTQQIQYHNLMNDKDAYTTELNDYNSRLIDLQNDLDGQNKMLDKAKKTLATAKKTKDKSVIDIAQKNLNQATADAKNAQLKVNDMKSKIRVSERNIKICDGQMETFTKIWKENYGINGYSEVDKGLEMLSTKRQNTENELAEIEAQRDFIIAEETRKIAEEEAGQEHLTIEQQVEINSKKVKDVLKPMTAELKAQIKAENDKKRNVKKSLFFIRHGRFYITA